MDKERLERLESALAYQQRKIYQLIERIDDLEDKLEQYQSESADTEGFYREPPPLPQHFGEEM